MSKNKNSKYTFLIPNMAPIHFGLLKEVFVNYGYNAVLLENQGANVVNAGLKYVHNDICYPAQLVIGQFLDALQTGRYDADHTALFITQTGGGCRASNYYFLLKKALNRAGYSKVPVISLTLKRNVSGEKKPFHLTPFMILQAAAGLIYGDMLMVLSNQIRPYEKNKGETDKMVRKWMDILGEKFRKNHGYIGTAMKGVMQSIAHDFSQIEKRDVKKLKVGIVGEIYMKYSPLGNNSLQDFLESEGCEVMIPPMMGFLLYGFENPEKDHQYYGKSKITSRASKLLVMDLENIEKRMLNAMRAEGNLTIPSTYRETKNQASDLLDYGVKMGEGWLLAAEMNDLALTGYSNIVCAQPFGCLPNHIVAKGMVRRVSEKTDANIVAVDYDPSSTVVNQQNRIKLMLAIAKEKQQGN